MIVVDASVAIKTALHEPDSPIAMAALRAQTWSAPDLIMAECANIIWKRYRLGEIEKSQALEAMTLVDTMNLYIEPSRRLIARVVPLSLALGHAAYDCFYLAHAEQLRAPFLTADRKLIEKVRASTATEVEMLTLQDYARESGL